MTRMTRMTRMTIFYKKAVLIMLGCLGASLSSCQQKVIRIDLPNKNPIEYTFNASMDDLYNAIIKRKIFLKLSVMTIEDKRIIPHDILELFLQSNSNHDIFLWSVVGFYKSKIYENNDGAFYDYWVSFYLHLEKIDEVHTKISIKTIDPKIIIGRDLLPSPPNMVRNYKTIPAVPSTIEEYEILLEIGKLVGEKNMPPINLPEKK